MFFTRSPRRRPSIRRWSMAIGYALFACLMMLGTATASTDPIAELPVEQWSPLSERCQRAVNTYFVEAEWFMNHPGIDVDNPLFSFHWYRLWDSWYIVELECGIDIDNTGHLGY